VDGTVTTEAVTAKVVGELFAFAIFNFIFQQLQNIAKTL